MQPPQYWESRIGPYRVAYQQTVLAIRQFAVDEGMLEQKIASTRITGRLKEYQSAREKLKRIMRKRKSNSKEWKRISECVFQDFRTHVEDLAGVRVVCDYLDEIDVFVNFVETLNTIDLRRPPDNMIEHPKPGGYRSLHMDTWVNAGTGRVKCEFQVRTMHHDSWATKAHSLIYKKSDQQIQRLPAALLELMATLSTGLHTSDEQALLLRTMIENYEGGL